LKKRLFFSGKQFIPQGITDSTVGATPFALTALALPPGVLSALALPARPLPSIRIHFKKRQIELTPSLPAATFLSSTVFLSSIGGASFLTPSLMAITYHTYESRFGNVFVPGGGMQGENRLLAPPKGRFLFTALDCISPSHVSQ